MLMERASVTTAVLFFEQSQYTEKIEILGNYYY
jgi:hypothetical protein